MIKWKRTAQGAYESNAEYWNEEHGEQRPLYVIRKTGTGFILYVRKKAYIIGMYFSNYLNRDMETICFATLKQAKQTAERLEAEAGTAHQTEEERGFAEGGGWSGAAWITGDGKGGSWHKDEEGNIIEG